MIETARNAKGSSVPVKAIIRGVKNEAPGVITFLMEKSGPPVQPPYLPAARPGQFNMLGYPGVGEAPISFSVLPPEKNTKSQNQKNQKNQKNLFGHTVRAAGRVTGFLSGFGEGDEVFLRGPFGRGWPLEEARGKHLLLLTGGLGLAPLKPVIEMAPTLGASGVTLLHGAREPRDIIFKTELARWKSEGAIEIELTVDNPEDNRDKGQKQQPKTHSGLITELIRPLRIDPSKTVAFICGPEIMMRFAARELLLKGIAGSGIYVSVERRMSCGTGHCGHCQIGPWFTCKDGPVFSYTQLKGLPDVIL